ncbi:MAG: tRNA (adenosine(37)-N6)-threonylcarbamoyltransferase complex transferase subunit TsaD [candidate division Zixibacteria bacterium]|nr:tRNA (adenosine(37)-N6)-threonylcarbamoyltransferase complex transferase subunit TsaD [candidate division Zixibacteria bacterium]
MLVLGIETSCDETAVAVIEDGQKILSNVVFSQWVHKKYWGVVPELASREHIKSILPLLKASLEEAKVSLNKIDGIAVTCGPGLVGSLLIGLCVAKGLSYSLKKPLIGINHLEGHIFSNFIEHPELFPPFVCLVVSGGHSTLVHVKDKGDYRVLGRTRDDAPGEAFDKVARILDLEYPGGPSIDRIAQKCESGGVRFPRAFLEEGSFDFSFSGLKTAVAIYVSKLSPQEREKQRDCIAKGFQEAIVDVLVDKSLKAALELKVNQIAIAGGVANNSRLRQKLSLEAIKEGLELYIPSPVLCTDNAAMIAAAGYFHLHNGENSPLDLNAYPHLSLEQKV